MRIYVRLGSLALLTYVTRKLKAKARSEGVATRARRGTH